MRAAALEATLSTERTTAAATHVMMVRTWLCWQRMDLLILVCRSWVFDHTLCPSDPLPSCNPLTALRRLSSWKH